MKMTASEYHVQDQMRPGVISGGGFLGADARPLADIIAADEQAMRHQGLEFYLVADQLHELLQAALEALGTAAIVQSRWRVRADDTKGTLPSPWEDGIFHKQNVTVERLSTGETIVFNELSLHLLEKHHFLQGRGSAYRLEPETLSAVLAG